MSFSFQAKNEMARVNAVRPCCQKAELAAMLKMSGSLQINTGRLVLMVNTENPAVARKVFKLFKSLYKLPISVMMGKNSRLKKGNYYLVKAELPKEKDSILEELGIMRNGELIYGVSQEITRSRCCRRAYLRGAFLARGSVNRPEGNYHLEIIVPYPETARDLCRMLEREKVKARPAERKQTHLVYIKDSESIVDLLRLGGANTSLLAFENARIVKSVRNQVNRQVNCETANLEKTVQAAMRQKELIEQLIEQFGLETIPESWRDIGLLRVDYPDCSLKELGAMLEPPMPKSGVAYRLRRLEELAQRLLPADRLT
ncbi:MAG: DNA-binding protein WhiA [Methylocystaceae bacterium]